MALVEKKTFSHSLNGWFEVTSNDRRDQLKEHRGLGLVLTDVANVIDHQQGIAIELVE